MQAFKHFARAWALGNAERLWQRRMTDERSGLTDDSPHTLASREWVYETQRSLVHGGGLDADAATARASSSRAVASALWTLGVSG